MPSLREKLASLNPEEAEYFLAEVPSHLVAAEQWERLSSVLSDMDFLQAKCVRIGVLALVQDFVDSTARMPSSEPCRDDIQLIGRALLGQLDRIQLDPHLTFQQLYNELMPHPAPKAELRARLRTFEDGQKQTWLRVTPHFLSTEPARVLSARQDQITGMVISQDEHWIAVTSSGSITLWRLDTGELKWSRELPAEPTTIAFVEEGKFVLSVIDIGMPKGSLEGAAFAAGLKYSGRARGQEGEFGIRQRVGVS